MIMKTTICVHPDYKTFFDDKKLSSFNDFFHIKNGDVVDSNRKRCVFRVAFNNPARVFYIKTFHTPSFNNSISSLFYYGKAKSEAQIEWENALLLQAHGFNTIPLAAFGEQTVCGFEKRSFFISEEIKDSIPLDDWLAHNRDYTLMNDLLTFIGLQIKKLHDAGFSYPDLYLKHMFINVNAVKKGDYIFSYLDLHRLRKKKKCSLQERIRDLTAFFFSAEPFLNSGQVDIALTAYTDSHTEKKLLQSKIEERCAKLRSRRSHDKGIITRRVQSDNGMLFINENYYSALHEAGIDTFEALFSHQTDGQNITDNPGRHVDTFSLGSGNATSVFYIKKHTPRKRQNTSKSRKEIYNAAREEWRNHLICQRFEVNVPVPVAWGYKSDYSASIMITSEIHNGVSLETVLHESRLTPELKEECINQIAFMARALHSRNFFHKDFYAGHIFIQQENGSVKFYLLDLQRLKKHMLSPKRWCVKDLAQLQFTTRFRAITLKDRIDFLHCYLQCSKLDKSGRALFRAIQKKTQKIENHIPKVLKRKNIHSWEHLKDNA